MRWPALVLVLMFPAAAIAQKYEAELRVSGMHLHKIDQAPLNIGGRFRYSFAPSIAADAELSQAPGSAGDTLALFGVRLLHGLHRAGVFVDGRSGIIHFTGGYFQTRLNVRTHTIAELGGGFEYYPARRLAIRIEANDAVIYYGNARFFNRPNPDALGTVHNFQPSIGIGVRF